MNHINKTSQIDHTNQMNQTGRTYSACYSFSLNCPTCVVTMRPP